MVRYQLEQHQRNQEIDKVTQYLSIPERAGFIAGVEWADQHKKKQQMDLFGNMLKVKTMDKIEKIKEEIERRINDLKGYVLQKGSDQRWVTAIDQLTWIKAFIDSFPEESASEDLDRLVISLEETIGTSSHSREVIKEHLQKVAEWQKQQMMKNAVKAEVFTDYNINFGYGSLTANIDLDEQHLKEGDKVKIIIVKEEQ